jgi:hypothetical protein
MIRHPTRLHPPGRIGADLDPARPTRAEAVIQARRLDLLPGSTHRRDIHLGE